jgi:hypothetical protein
VLVFALFTVCDTLPLEPEWLLSPAYVAVTASLPTASAEVVHVAVPGKLDTVELVQPVFADQLTFPVDVGVRSPCRIAPNWAVIVAVNVTLWPHTDGFVPEATVVVDVAPFTVCVSVPVEVLKFVSPEYAPLRLCVPSLSAA